MDFPKLEDLKVGDTLVSAIQCDCLFACGEYVVQSDEDGFFVHCEMGTHPLDKHLKDGRLNGFYLKVGGK